LSSFRSAEKNQQADRNNPPVTTCFITHLMQTSPQTFAENQMLKKTKKAVRFI